MGSNGVRPWPEACWDDLGVPQKMTMAKVLVMVMAEMFALTPSHCSSLLRDLSLDDSKHSLHYNLSAIDASVVDVSIVVAPDEDTPDEVHTITANRGVVNMAGKAMV